MLSEFRLDAEDGGAEIAMLEEAGGPEAQDLTEEARAVTPRLRRWPLVLGALLGVALVAAATATLAGPTRAATGDVTLLAESGAGHEHEAGHEHKAGRESDEAGHKQEAGHKHEAGHGHEAEHKREAGHERDRDGAKEAAKGHPKRERDGAKEAAKAPKGKAAAEEKVECAADNKFCGRSKCCSSPGSQCFSKDHKWAVCSEHCKKGVHKYDLDKKPWTCRKLGKRTPGCHQPARKSLKPSLFCWSMMVAGSPEEELVKSQLRGFAGIFSCNDYAIIARSKVLLGKDECGKPVKSWSLAMPAKLEKGMYGVNAETSSYLNVKPFMDSWNALINSGVLWKHAFVVKADPDAVFFPNRLRWFSKPHQKDPTFFTNCRYWGGDQVGKLFGAVEILSSKAIGAYHAKNQTCFNMPWQRWGEDMWMQKCMDAIGVKTVGAFDQTSDTACPLGGGASCTDTGKFAFHPYKDAGQWWQCQKMSK